MFKMNGVNQHIRGSIVRMESFTHALKLLHAIECGQQQWTANQLELIALGEMDFSRLGLCSEDLW